LMDSLKKNDEVITTGGVIGKIVRVMEKEIVVRVDDKVQVRFHKSAIIGRYKEVNADSKPDDKSNKKKEKAK